MSSVSYTLRATPAMLRVAWADLFAYRAEMAIWILTNILPLFVLALWDAVLAGGDISGFDRAASARYFVAVLILRQLTGNWIAWELSFHIRSGSLNGLLLRPVHPLWVSAVWMTAALPWRLAILAPMIGLLLVARPDMLLWPGFDALALCAVSSALAWLLAFLIQAIVGCLSFWIDKADGAFGVWFAVWSIAGGYLAPTAFYPAWAQGALRWLPFRGTLAVPVELLGGFLTPAQALPEVGIQLGWCVVFSAVLAWVWRRGLVRYGAFGT